MRILVLLVGLSSFAGCKQSRIDRETDAKNVTFLAPKDEGMEAAIEKARRTRSEFLDALRSKNPSFHDFAVKQAYPTPTGHREYLWLGDLVERDGQLFGQVANEPVETEMVKYGQSVSVDLETISDWKYLNGKRLVGGATIRYQLARMSPAARKQFESQIDFIVEP